MFLFHLPPLYIHSPALLAQAKPALDAFASLFPFVPVETASSSGGKRKAHFWSDITGGDGTTGGETSGGAGEASSGDTTSKAAKGTAAALAVS
jgi:hypothetical protein